MLFVVEVGRVCSVSVGSNTWNLAFNWIITSLPVCFSPFLFFRNCFSSAKGTPEIQRKMLYVHYA